MLSALHWFRKSKTLQNMGGCASFAVAFIISSCVLRPNFFLCFKTRRKHAIALASLWYSGRETPWKNVANSGLWCPASTFPLQVFRVGGWPAANLYTDLQISTVWCSKSTVEPPDTGLFVPVSELNLELASAEASLDWTFNNEPYWWRCLNKMGTTSWS